MAKNVWRWLRPVFVVVLVALVALTPASGAWAKTGGRMGGSSFRAPSYSAPRSSRSIAPSTNSYNYYGGGYGGGFGFPLLLPFFLGGGGGLLPLLLVVGAGSFVVRALRNRELDGNSATETVEISEVRIAMLSSARTLQPEMDRMAQTADTGSASGLSQLLQDVTLSLLRHQDYWAYGSAQSRTVSYADAEQVFYQRSLQERSTFTAETLTRVGSQAVQKKSVTPANGDTIGQYVVVTLLVASSLKLSTLSVVDAASLRQALMQWGSLPADHLMAMEVLWTPQAEGDVLTEEDLVVNYPQLRRL